MIKVHKYGPAFGLPDASPFVIKLETYLRMTGQAYETVASDVRKAPRRQLPLAEIDGRLIADSTVIIEQLEAARPDKLDAHIDFRQQAVPVAFKSMLEEHLYFGLLFMRWITDDGWTVFEPSIRDLLAKMGVPSFMRGMIAKKAREQTSGRTRAQGMGRKPRAEVVAECNRLIDALSVQFGEGPYFCGSGPTTYDATVYAFVASLLCPAFDNELRKHTAAKENLVAYDARMKERYWESGR